MSRLGRLLSALLAIVLIAVAGLMLMVTAAKVPEVAESGPRFAGVTAREAFYVAEPAAREWAADGQLLSMRATWRLEADLSGGEASWSLIFYSATRSETALISVIENEAVLVNTRPTDQAHDPDDISHWLLNSPQAAENALKGGGQAFLDSQGSADLVMTLSLDRPANWNSTFIDKQSLRTFSIRMDATNGDVLEIQQSE